MTKIYIPARLKSKRLKEKPLILIDGLPLIIHVLKRCQMSKTANDVIVCADDKKIINIVKKYNGKAILTSKKYKNGTERISNVCRLEKDKKSQLIIDVQCDEIFINPDDIDRLIKFHKKNKQFDIVIPHSIVVNNHNNKNLVKIVHDKLNKILYLSRADIPFSFRNKTNKIKKHLDFISFKTSALKKFKNFKESPNEKYEGIELLRAVENDLKIGTLRFNNNNFSINTKEDLRKARKIIKTCKVRKKY